MKRFLALILSFSVLFAFASCATGGGSSTPSKAQTGSKTYEVVMPNNDTPITLPDLKNCVTFINHKAELTLNDDGSYVLTLSSNGEIELIGDISGSLTFYGYYTGSTTVNLSVPHSELLKIASSKPVEEQEDIMTRITTADLTKEQKEELFLALSDEGYKFIIGIDDDSTESFFIDSSAQKAYYLN